MKRLCARVKRLCRVCSRQTQLLPCHSSVTVAAGDVVSDAQLAHLLAPHSNLTRRCGQRDIVMAECAAKIRAANKKTFNQTSREYVRRAWLRIRCGSFAKAGAVPTGRPVAVAELSPEQAVVRWEQELSSARMPLERADEKMKKLV